MRPPSLIAAVVVCSGLAASAATADTIVQTGEIQELGEVEIVLDQFDDQGGALRLNFVQIDLFSSMFGGFTTSGIGGNVRVSLTFDQDYFLGSHFLAGTRCTFGDTRPNDFVAAFSFLVSDTDEAVVDQRNRLLPWIGTGQITLTSVGEVDWDIIPPEGLIDYGVSLTGEYTVTYDFTVLNCSGDVNGDEVVNVIDLLLVIAAFGNAGGPEDVNADGLVNVIDLLEVIAQWGPCPGD